MYLLLRLFRPRRCDQPQGQAIYLHAQEAAKSRHRPFGTTARKPRVLTTLQQNGRRQIPKGYIVESAFETPIKLHYSQTKCTFGGAEESFETPIKLHYSQTHVSCNAARIRFETPIKSHYSQTIVATARTYAPFETPIKSHYSQTFK